MSLVQSGQGRGTRGALLKSTCFFFFVLSLCLQTFDTAGWPLWAFRGLLLWGNCVIKLLHKTGLFFVSFLSSSHESGSPPSGASSVLRCVPVYSCWGDFIGLLPGEQSYTVTQDVDFLLFRFEVLSHEPGSAPCWFSSPPEHSVWSSVLIDILYTEFKVAPLSLRRQDQERN